MADREEGRWVGRWGRVCLKGLGRVTITVALLRYMSFSIKCLPIAGVVIVNLLLVQCFIDQPSQHTLQILLSGTTHAVIIMDFLALHIYYEQSPMGVGQIQREIKFVKLEHIEFFRPSGNIAIGIIFFRKEQFFEKE